MMSLFGTAMPARARNCGVRFLESAVITAIGRAGARLAAIIGSCSRLDMQTGIFTASRTAPWNCNMKPQSLLIARTPCFSSSTAQSTAARASSGAPPRHAFVESPGTTL